MISAKVISELTETLREMRDPDPPWRDEANTLIENLIDDLAHDPEMGAQGEALKQEILANPVFAEQAQTLHEELETALRDELPGHAEANVSGSDLRQRAQPIARRRRAGPREDQSAQTPGATNGPATRGGNRRLYRRDNRQLGHRDAHQSP
jgi:Protein of unknown function (DUF445)